LILVYLDREMFGKTASFVWKRYVPIIPSCFYFFTFSSFFHLFFIFFYFSLHLISTARTTFTFTGLCPTAPSKSKHDQPPKEPEHGRLAGGGQGRATGGGARVARPCAPSSSLLSWSCGRCSFSPPGGSFRTYDEKIITKKIKPEKIVELDGVSSDVQGRVSSDILPKK
jgi:hypothetical protein